MRPNPVRQLPLQLGVGAVDLPREAIDEARRLLSELLLHVGRDPVQEKGGRDEREDPSHAPRA